MRRLLLVGSIIAGLTLAALAGSATVTVSITKTGFFPKTVTISQGDLVTWTNTDTASHQVVADKGEFVSPVLKPSESYSFTFNTAETFPYHDGIDKKLKGTVTVKAAPQSVTMAASKTKVIFGGPVTLSGTVSNHNAGENVAVLAQAFGQTSITPVGSVTTTAGGDWSFTVKPQIQTTYGARWKSATSSLATIGVRPKITFRVLTSRRFSTKAIAERSLAGKYVLLQRRSAFGQWVSIKRRRLGTTSSAIFRATLPKGTSSLRIFMSVNQAGPGYLAGISRTIIVFRG